MAIKFLGQIKRFLLAKTANQILSMLIRKERLNPLNWISVNLFLRLHSDSFSLKNINKPSIFPFKYGQTLFHLSYESEIDRLAFSGNKLGGGTLIYMM